jgi:hypothetical protein
VALFQGRDDDALARDDDRRETTDVQGAWSGPPLVRALLTLLGVAVAGFLLWVAQLVDPSTTNGFWAAMGIIAGAGLVLGLSQLLGGWTKWGIPHISRGVLLLAWLPTAIAVGWVMMVVQPQNGWYQGKLESWSASIGIQDFVHEIGTWPGALALGLGIVTAFTLDTKGPRPTAIRDMGEGDVPDEDVQDYDQRGEVAGSEATDTTAADDRTMVAAAGPRVEPSEPERPDTP